MGNLSLAFWAISFFLLGSLIDAADGSIHEYKNLVFTKIANANYFHGGIYASEFLDVAASSDTAPLKGKSFIRFDDISFVRTKESASKLDHPQTDFRAHPSDQGRYACDSWNMPRDSSFPVDRYGLSSAPVEREQYVPKIIDVTYTEGSNDKKWSSRDFPWTRKLEVNNKKVFGNHSFRPNQREIINATMSGSDVFVLMPTGGGKSLTYQLPALICGGITLVISPLVSLIQDQIMNLLQVGTVAALIFCLPLRPHLLKVTPELVNILQETVWAVKLMNPHPQVLTSFYRLRTACIELLCTTIALSDSRKQTHNELRAKLNSMFFKSFTCRAPDIVAVAKEGLRQRIAIGQRHIGSRCRFVCHLIWCLLLLSAWSCSAEATRQHDYEPKISVLGFVLLVAGGLLFVAAVIYGMWFRGADPQPPPEDVKILPPEDVNILPPENKKLKKKKKRKKKQNKQEDEEERIPPPEKEEEKQEEKQIPAFEDDNCEDAVKNSVEVNDWESIKNVTVPAMEIGEVAQGFFEQRPVAVKCVVRSSEINNEIAILTLADGHPNILRYYCSEHKKNWSIYCLEPWICTLGELIKFWKEKSKSTEESEPQCAWKDDVANYNLWTMAGDPLPILIKLIRDVVRGIEHLHAMQIIHRDLRPENVMIVSNGRSLLAKIDDLGVAKYEARTSLSLRARGEKSRGWRAPELLSQDETGDETSAADIFSLGVLIFYTITCKHPFKANNINLTALQIPEPLHLVRWMLSKVPTSRPTASEVLIHPFFWSFDERLSFLTEASDRLMACDNSEKNELELRANAVINGQTWGPQLHPDHFTYIDHRSHPVTYHYHKLEYLIRLVRNTRHHHREFHPHIQILLGTSYDEVYKYFSDRFPKLLMEVYDFIYENFKEEEAFKKYFKG